MKLLWVSHAAMADIPRAVSAMDCTCSKGGWWVPGRRVLFAFGGDQLALLRVDHEVEATEVASVHNAGARQSFLVIVLNLLMTGWARPRHLFLLFR